MHMHIQTNTPLDLISSKCVKTTTTSFQEPNNDGLIIGLGSGLGLSSLLLLVSVVSVLVGVIVSKIYMLKLFPTRLYIARGHKTVR